MAIAKWSALLSVPLLTACGDATAPVRRPSPRLERFAPPPVYDLWWSMARDCSGRNGSLHGVAWYVVPGTRSIVVNGKSYKGYWYALGNRIVLAEAAVLDGSLVRHEMLHALTSRGPHGRSDFLERCGGVVSCEGECLDDAGPLPPPDPGIVRVKSQGLDIDVVLNPQTPSRSLFDGHFTMTVTARNPYGHAILVELPPAGDAGPSVTFEYRVEFSGGYAQSNGRSWDDGVTRFAVAETKQYVFDFRIIDAPGTASDGGLGPGTYTFRGAYGGGWAPVSPTVKLSPP
jgi:hypothetical protein